MSTFGALNTAYRGLTAAQQGMNVAGQNIANAATEGYTRQRVDQLVCRSAGGKGGTDGRVVGSDLGGCCVDGRHRVLCLATDTAPLRVEGLVGGGDLVRHGIGGVQQQALGAGLVRLVCRALPG